jgi:hypothetical protein
LKNKIFVCLALFFAASSVEADAFDFLLGPVRINEAFINDREINVKAGYSLEGVFSAGNNLESFGDSELKSESSFSFSGEYFKYIDGYAAIGAGASYQIASGFDEYGGKIGFAPVYFAAKLRSWPVQPGVYGYAVGQIGYNFFYGDGVFLDNFRINGGGLYYALGFGIIYTDYIFECLYGVHSGIISCLRDNSGETGVELRRITLSLGYKF